MTMSSLLQSVGDIFTSCIEWIGDVGEVVMGNPRLLLFVLLPLCGIAVGFFKRLMHL